ncbi:MAG: AI-2E family transporter [Spirochaetaceae bacterium]|jgi:predicted PurR-regulated permease PerM|nr:AI-2E family transporter [Spirochaetaceae bacterium]
MIPKPKNIQNWIFILILSMLFILVCRIFAPFFSVFLWATLFYILIKPLHSRMVRNLTGTKIRARILRVFWAALFALGIVILILLPLGFLGVQLFYQLRDLLVSLRDLFRENPDALKEAIEDFVSLVRTVSGGQLSLDTTTIQNEIISSLSGGIQRILQSGTGAFRTVGLFSLNIAFMVFCLFFFFLDGAYLGRLVLHTIPIRSDYLDQLVGKFKEMARSLFFGYFIVAAIQASSAFVIFLIFHIRGALVFSVLILICAFIPMLGAGAVWIPLGIVRIVSGDIAGGLIFMAVCALTVSVMDNFLRPLFLHDRIKLHPLVIFFAILGGIMAFGFNGLILGPVLVALFLTVLDLFLSEHKIAGAA